MAESDNWPKVPWIQEYGPKVRDAFKNALFPTRNYTWGYEPVEPMFPEHLGAIPNMILNIPEHIGKAINRTAGNISSTVSPIATSIYNEMFVPEAEMDRRDEAAVSKAKANEAVQSPGGGVFAQPASGESVSDALSRNSGSLSLGPIYKPEPPPMIEPVQYGMPPDQPPPAERPYRTPFDFQPYMDQMAEFAPQDLNRRDYMKDRLLANLSRAFAAGASGSGWSGGAGAIARFGSGFGMGQADTTDQFLNEQAGIDQDQQQFELNRIGLEMKLAQEADNIAFENQQTLWANDEAVRQNTIANDAERYNVTQKNIAAAAEANQLNADRLWEFNAQQGDRYQTKVLPGTGKGLIVTQTVDKNTGEQKLNYINLQDNTMGGMYDNDSLNALQDIRDIHGEDSDLYQQALYAPIVAAQDLEGYKMLMAAQALRTGVLNQIIDEDQLEALDEQALDIVGQQGVQITDDDKYAAALSTAKARLAAQYIDLNNIEQMKLLANSGNFGARFRLRRPEGGVTQ